jgi:hypothetical protein
MAIKVAAASGVVRRLIVGDPAIQLIDVLVGTTLDRLAEAEHYAGKGEVVLDEQAAASEEQKYGTVVRAGTSSAREKPVVRA